MSDFVCKLCGEGWSDFYACRSHVYNKHKEETHGVAEAHPETYVREE